jgi:crooked neck
MELKARNVQHARNLFDRAVTLLPRINQIWYKYVFLEELLGNVPGARQVFERWMSWEPDEKAWSAYIKVRSPLLSFSKTVGSCLAERADMVCSV